jgi:hypothetical protein
MTVRSSPRTCQTGYPYRDFLAGVARIVVAACLVLSLGGCGLKEATEDCRATERAIKSELGVDAKVNCKIVSGTKGRKAFVTVHLNGDPITNSAATKAKVADIVNRGFHAHVERVDVTL